MTAHKAIHCGKELPFSAMPFPMDTGSKLRGTARTKLYGRDEESTCPENELWLRKPLA